MGEPVSFIRATQDFFSRMPFGKKIEIAEFKQLTYEDKVELREMLIGEGYNVSELSKPAPISS